MTGTRLDSDQIVLREGLSATEHRLFEFYSLVPEGSDVRFGQKRTFERLFNDLVGSGEQRRGHGETERLCCLQVYDQLVFAWRLHRQISGFLAA
jgi:hypothetical protein